MIGVSLKDGTGTDKSAKVSPYGHLVTGAFDFSKPYAVTASVINTGYNFVPPIAGKQFIITGLLLYANKGVGANDATVILYEASGLTSTTADTVIISTEMLKQTNRDIGGLNIIVSEGKWVNIKTDDNTVYATLLGYYVDVP